MSNSIIITALITRARSNSKFIEVRIRGEWYALHQNSARDLQILANLFRCAWSDGREKISALDLVGMEIEAEIVFDADGAADSLAWANCAGEDFIEAGPTLVDAASRAFFGREIRQRRDRHPAAMRAVRAGTCADCGAIADDKHRMEAHHIEPRAWGGEDEADNLVPLCRECHDKRHAESGAIAIRPGWYIVEVLDETRILGLVKIRHCGGSLSGRERLVEWGAELVRPFDGACYQAFLKAEMGHTKVLSVEPVMPPQRLAPLVGKL